MEFKYKNRDLNLEVHVCSFFERFSGLMFTRREKARALLFDFGKLVDWGFHSLFVFFPFVAIWFDEKDRIIVIKVVRPFRFHFSPKRNFQKVIEIPINKKYKKIVESIVGKR